MRVTRRDSPVRLTLGEQLNFLLTNRVPRQLLTHFMGWFSGLELPWLSRLSIALWRRFSDLDLSESEQSSFPSLQACFTRRLRPGSRPVDPHPASFVSPCDAIVGASGRIDGDRLYQIKGYPYQLAELLGDPGQVARYRDGTFVTLRLTATMYHHFHAPITSRVREVRYLSGDTWNVNPIALKRIEKLFCRNERVVVEATTEAQQSYALVAVAAILVASVRLPFINTRMHLRYDGPERIACDHPVLKGDELGWFEHGSTIVVLLPPDATLHESVSTGMRIRMGEPLAWLPVRVPGTSQQTPAVATVAHASGA